MYNPAPASVAKRERALRLTSFSFVVTILSVALYLLFPEVALFIWLLSIFVTTIAVLTLQRSIQTSKLTDSELDEYEFKLRSESRVDGLRAMLLSTMGLFFIAGIVALLTRFWPRLDGTTVAVLFSMLLQLQLLGGFYASSRSLAKKLNQDELVSMGS